MDNEYIEKYQLEIELIYYLVNRFLNGITKTRLLKLIYLIDFFSKEKLGKKITKFTYDYYYYGPYSELFIESLKFSKSHEVTEMTKIIDSSELIYLYFRGVKPRVSDELPSLNKSQKKIVEEVVKDYGSLKFEELINKVYKTKPIKRKSFGAKKIL